MTSEEFDANWLEDKLISSKFSNLHISSGIVTKLFAYKSKVFSFLIVYKLLILAGVIELYDKFKNSSL